MSVFVAAFGSPVGTVLLLALVDATLDFPRAWLWWHHHALPRRRHAHRDLTGEVWTCSCGSAIEHQFYRRIR